MINGITSKQLFILMLANALTIFILSDALLFILNQMLNNGTILDFGTNDYTIVVLLVIESVLTIFMAFFGLYKIKKMRLCTLLRENEQGGCNLSLLSLENITKSYDKKSIVLNEFNLSVNTGEMVAIMGKSGSGKSTVLNIISGIESADSGRYIFKGNDMSKVSGDKMTVFRRENIGFVLQHFALIENNSVFKNIALPLYLKHESKNVIKGKVLELAKDLEIENKLDKKPKQLSGGEAQRVAIARAIINQPSLILADEPTGALDENTGLKIMQIFRKLHQKGHTFIIVTHDSSVAEMCDRTIKIKDGKNV